MAVEVKGRPLWPVYIVPMGWEYNCPACNAANCIDDFEVGRFEAEITLPHQCIGCGVKFDLVLKEERKQINE